MPRDHSPRYLVENQNRSAPPSEFENRLADGLEAAFLAGASDLDELVRALNDAGVLAPDGTPWTAASFTDEITRLGA